MNKRAQFSQKPHQKSQNNNVIKNPQRELNKNNQPDPYQPEYMRLNKKPTVYPVDKNDFIRPKNKTLPLPPSSSSSRAPNNEKKQFTPPPSKKFPPQSNMVNSGNFSSTWRPDDEEQSSIKLEWENPNISAEELEKEEEKLKTEIFEVEEKCDPNEPDPEAEEFEEEFEDEEAPENSEFEKYIIFYQNKIVFTSNILSDIEEFLNNIKDIDLERIVVLKKLKIKSGISITE